MHTARATVSMGKFARLRMACTRGTEAVAREADEGMRLTRWMAGPASSWVSWTSLRLIRITNP